MKNITQAIFAFCFLLSISNLNAQLCSNPSTVITLSNVVSLNSFQSQVNSICPNAVTYNSTTNTYTLQNFIPKICVSGYFWVTANFTINNCHQITFDANATMNVVAQNATLYIESSTLKACGNTLWGGISMDNTSNNTQGSLIKVYNSTIMQANTAVNVSNENATTYATFDIYNTTFDQNYIGLKAYRGASSVHAPGLVRRSRFYCTSTLLAPFTNQKSIVGIHVLLVNNLFNVGKSTDTNPADFNIFDGIACGIYSKGSTTFVYSSIFRNISQYATTLISGSPSYTDDIRGCGIFQRGFHSNLLLGGSGDPTVPGSGTAAINNIVISPTVRFENSSKGIELHNTHATVNGCTFSGSTNMLSGVIIENCNNANIQISNLYSDKLQYGIFANLNENSDIMITGCQFHLQNMYNTLNATYYGIKIVDWPSYNLNSLILSGNQIWDGKTGIHLENVTGAAQAVHNTITQTTPNSTLPAMPMYGIYVKNSNGYQLTDNIITGYTGAWTSYYKQTGIYLEASPAFYLRCNSITNTGYGVWANGNNSSIFGLEKNAFNNHKYAVYLSKLGNYGIIGDQGSSTIYEDNTFNGTYTGTFKTFNQTDASQNPLTTDAFWYAGPNSYMYTTNFSSSNPTGKPVRVFPIPGSYTTPYTCPQFLMAPSPNMNTTTEPITADEAEKIATEEKTYPEFEEVTKWIDERNLYKAVEDNPSAYSGSENIEEFHAAKSVTSVGEFEEYYKLLNTLKDTAIQGDATAMNLRLAELKQRNTSIDANTDYEQNEKNINEIFLNTIAEGNYSFTQAQFSIISDLAYSCPYVAGKAVYLARSLYYTKDHTAYFDDVDICNNVGYNKTEKVSPYDLMIEKVKEYAYITPNPIDAYGNLYYYINAEDEGKIEIADLLGRKVYVQNVSGDKTHVELNLSLLRAGTYFYSIQTTKGFKSSGKVIVVN